MSTNKHEYSGPNNVIQILFLTFKIASRQSLMLRKEYAIIIIETYMM